jgi:IS605 OrfB family transposase
MSYIQRKIIDEWIDTVRYVYNRTVYEINTNKHEINFMKLRNKLVTENTATNSILYKEIDDLYSKKKTLNTKIKELNKNITLFEKKQKKNKKLSIFNNVLLSIKINGIKNKIHIKQKELEEIENSIKEKEHDKKKILKEKNKNIKEWELNTPKEVRAGAVNDIVKAYKTGFSNLKAGNIRYFRVNYRKKTELNKCIVIAKSMIHNDNGTLKIAKQFLKEESEFKMGFRNKKKYKNLEINNDCRLVKQNNEYWLLIPLSEKIKEKKKTENYCGIDPGVRTFMTTFGNNGCYEYTHNKEKIKKLNTKIDTIKTFKQIRKRSLLKIEKKKSNLIKELHWKTINDILNKNDIIYYGDIKSHDIVSNEDNHNRYLKRDINDLKFYQFKQRLQYKALQRNKLVLLVSEEYTTKTCSSCGNIRNVGISKTYECIKCKSILGRDINAAKNILIKGIIKT